jgi:prevent-host-death family protein
LTRADQSFRLVITMRTMTATEFKARCLALLDEVAATGEVITVLKHGRPVAQLVPAVPRAEGHPQDALAGTVEILGDVIGPVLEPDVWESEGRGGPDA